MCLGCSEVYIGLARLDGDLLFIVYAVCLVGPLAGERPIHKVVDSVNLVLAFGVRKHFAPDHGQPYCPSPTGPALLVFVQDTSE